jgi:molybdopterin-guanine dinucleotide biosynthesis protein A
MGNGAKSILYDGFSALAVDLPLTAIILLAGGRSSRMGSNKALYSVGGEPMVRRITDRLSGLSDEFLVVIARHASRAEYAGILPNFVKVINDELEGKTPLVGIITGLRAAKSQYAIVLSCDIPFVNSHVIQLLLKRASGADAAVPKWKAGHLEPLQAAYRKVPMLHEAEQTLAKGELAPIDAISRLSKVVYVSVEGEIKIIDPELRSFVNVNTRQEVSMAEMILRQEQKEAALRTWSGVHDGS